MFINKVLELYREACKHGLSVSLSINNMNGQESFSLATIPGPDLAGRPERRRRPRGGRRQRRRRQDQQECSARATQPAAVAPSYAAVVRSPPSPLQPSTAKRAKHSSAAVERAVATHTAAESADEAVEGTPCDATNTTFSTMDACTDVPAAVVSAPATALAGRAAAAVSLAEEPAAANILHRDGIINAAADVHPRRRRCNPPPHLMQLRGRNQSFRSSSPNIISSPTPSTPPSPLPQLDGCVTSPLYPNVNPLPPSATHKSTQTNPSPTPPPTLINTSTQTISSPATVDVCTSPTIPNPPDPTPNPTSAFSSKLTYNSISPIHTRSCTRCEKKVRDRENLKDRNCISCFKKLDGSSFHQQFCAAKFTTSTEYFSIFLCTHCYNNKEYCRSIYHYHNNDQSLWLK